LHDKRKVKAKLLGSDKATDIAILKIDEKKLTSLPIGDSDAVEVGDFAIAIGNPFGLNNTVTSGIISGLSRSGLGIEGYEDFIQTDASINPGNSGGALINLRGELIGINTAILSGSGGNIGIGFAIPYNMVKTVTQQLIQHGEVKRGQIGIYTQNITPELSEAMNINVKHGALISKVNKGSPAEKSGLKEGDVIIKIDGKDMENISALRNAIGLKQIGTKVNVTFIRGKETKSVQTDIIYPNEIEDSLSDTLELPKLKGTKFSHIPTTHPMYGKIEGVMITNIEKNSQAWRTGLKSGDIVVSVNRQKIKNLKELKNAVLLKKDGILMKVQRENAAMYIFLTSE
jgi:Do/DeqQ family serine protease